jgi:hypothetical protein
VTYRVKHPPTATPRPSPHGAARPQWVPPTILRSMAINSSVGAIPRGRPGALRRTNY